MELENRTVREGASARQSGEIDTGIGADEVANPQQHPHDALPPTDGGYQAWLLLSGCFIINVLVWGFAFSFGVLQEYYMKHEPFASNPNGIPTIGTTATGLMYLLMPVYFYALQRWPVLKKYSTWASLPVVAGALIGASFAQTVPQLIALQGVMYAIGGNMLVTPTITYLDEWFVRRKGLAIGIMWAGDGAGGVIMTVVLQALLSRYGFRVALRCLACAFVVLMAPLLLFVKPRLPIPMASTVRPIDTSFLRSPVFWVLQVFNIVQGTGYFLPMNYLPTYAESIGLGSKFGSLTLVMVNLTAILGCIITGALVDRLDVTVVMLGISVAAAAAILAVWGVSTSIAPLCAFSLLYGLTAGSYSTAWAGMIKDVQRHVANVDANVIFGFLAAGRGIGAVAAGPLSDALIASSGQSMHGYGGAYGSLVIFAGCTTLAGGCGWFVRRAGFI